MSVAMAAEASTPEQAASFGAPLPSHWSVRHGRDAYLAENGFSLAAYDERWTTAETPLGLTLRVPNTPRHRWAIMLHDLHHVATGYGTDLAGEAEVSAWEARRGLRPLGLYVGSIVVAGVLAGLLTAPRRTLRAWRAAGGGTSLFHSARSYEELLELDVGTLRQELCIPQRGLATEPRKRHAGAPRSPPREGAPFF
jgi:hypothetical protein